MVSLQTAGKLDENQFSAVFLFGYLSVDLIAFVLNGTLMEEEEDA